MIQLILIDEKAAEAKGISQVEEVDPQPLLDPSEVVSGVLCSILVCRVQEGQGTTEEETTKMIRSLEHLSHEKRLQELPLFLSLEKTDISSIHTNISRAGARFFSAVPIDRMRSNTTK